MGPFIVCARVMYVVLIWKFLFPRRMIFIFHYSRSLRWFQLKWMPEIWNWWTNFGEYREKCISLSNKWRRPNVQRMYAAWTLTNEHALRWACTTFNNRQTQIWNERGWRVRTKALNLFDVFVATAFGSWPVTQLRMSWYVWRCHIWIQIHLLSPNQMSISFYGYHISGSSFRTKRTVCYAPIMAWNAESEWHLWQWFRIGVDE